MVAEFARKLHMQNETSLMLNNLQEAIIIKSEHKIDYMNENFVGLFHKIIDQNFEKFETQSLQIEDI